MIRARTPCLSHTNTNNKNFLKPLLSRRRARVLFIIARKVWVFLLFLNFFA